VFHGEDFERAVGVTEANPVKVKSLRRDRCSFTIIATVRLPTSLTKPALPTSAGDLALPSVTTTMTDGPDIYIATIPLKPHHVAANSADAAEMALEAGVDFELPAADAYHSLVGQVGAPSGL
jgi:hypothetical protein